MRDVFANIEANVQFWSDNGEEVLGDRLALIKSPPARSLSPPMATPLRLGAPPMETSLRDSSALKT